MHKLVVVLLTLCPLLAIGQSKKSMPTYQREWKEVDSLIARGLPKSALTQINKIYQQAKEAKNYPQVAKAVIYRTNYQFVQEEEEFVALVRTTKQDIQATPEPTRSVLESVLADTYWQYYNRNRYKFYDRATAGRATIQPSPGTASPDDPRTWDARQLIDAVTSAYLASVQEKALLQQTPVSAYDALLIKGDAEARALRPTLFDLLAHRAIDFFKNTEPDLHKPIFRFEVDDVRYLAGPDVFVQLPLQSKDSLSGRFQALQLYQQLLRFHVSDKNPQALADADVQRLQFVHTHSTVPNKDLLLHQTLRQQKVRYAGQPAEATYAYALAQSLVSLTDPYQLRTDEGDTVSAKKWHRKQAADICRDLIKRFPKTRAAAEADELLTQLLRPECTLTVEEVNAPKTPFRALLTYQNVKQVRYRIIRLSTSEWQATRQFAGEMNQRKQKLQQWLKRPSIVEKTVVPPDDGDLNNHSVEIPIEGLPLGQYLVLLSQAEKSANNAEALSFATFTISSLALLEPDRGKFDQDTLFVVNRLTGQPLANATVQPILEKRLRPTASQPTVRTNEEGRAVVSTRGIPRESTYWYQATWAGDTLLSDTRYKSDYYPAQEDPAHSSVRLFTDRAIYRPGQAIYVKGLVFGGSRNRFEIEPNREVKVTFRDQNGEEVAQKEVRTNEFGTFATTFTAPVGRVTGMMTISTEHGSTYVRVEEYKRPTFEVVTQPIRQSFKLGQTITLTAQTRTFAGAAVDGASVRYRVVRYYRQPWWGWWEMDEVSSSKSLPGRRIDKTEIANGAVQTDVQGNVTISFPATPDLTKPKRDNPVFVFEVTFDVTDRAGETRSTTQTLQIGYTALQVELAVPNSVDKSGKNEYSLKVTNQSDQPVRAQGQLTVYALQAPDRLLRTRLWSRPDRHLLSKAEYLRLFPHDIYANENDPRTWPRGQAVEQQSFQSPADSTFRPDLNRYQSGQYVAEVVVRDSTGEETTERVYFRVMDNRQPTASVLPEGWLQTTKTTVEPGEELVFWVGNTQPGWVLMQVEENHRITRREWLKTDGTPRRVSLPVTEKNRGGFVVHFAMVQNSRLYEKAQTITVPFSDKLLRIETQVFRDKLKPGQPEEWTLLISGPKQDNVLAELAATLYDASLDQFSVLRWQTDIYQTYFQYYTNNGIGFGINMSQWWIYPTPVQTGRVDPIQYDALRGQGGMGSRGPGREIKIRGYARETMMESAVAPLSDAMAAAPSAARNMKGGSGAENTPSSSERDQRGPTIPIVPRRNFTETAFFFPQLHTDPQGRVVLKFTMPDALTRWRLLAFAHTKDLKIGTLEREIVTQKELMITANAPRFLREGDTLRLTARLNNLTAKTLTGTARLELFDALTNEPINQKLGNSAGALTFTVAGKQSTALGWTLVVPAGLETVTYRLSAQAGDFTDGEEQTLPVLPNRMLVTDTQPFWVNGGKETKEFKLTALTNQNPELPSQHERLTVEVTSNPAWYALQSLPYLMEYRYECAEQLFSRIYANTLAAHIITSKPAFRQVIDEWKRNPPRNPLQANEELKAVTLENTPWLAQARNEAERQAQLGQLFDQNRMNNELTANVTKLIQLQTPEGGFRWFGGMAPNLTMTLHILGGFGHLQKLGVALPQSVQAEVRSMTELAIAYVDAELATWVAEQKKAKTVVPNPYLPVQYLYARSFYPGRPINGDVMAYLRQQLAANWLKQSLQGQAFTALALYRFGDRQVPQQILESLTERAKVSEELGMYWPENKSGFGWYEAPIETQAYLIEAFEEIGKNPAVADDLRRWLIRQKQTQAWHSTKATTEAVYALLLRGTDWLDTRSTAEVRVGGQRIDSRVTQTEAVTGYQKVTYAASEIKPEMGVIQLSKKGAGPAWGAVYWQHFEPLDRIPAGSAGLSVQKELYVQTDSPAGPVVTPLWSAGSLKPGDLVTVRLVLQTDRTMEYVHLKDGRASGFEPVDALSGFKYQNGLGYYESPRDASTDFFLSYVPVGTHVFEYRLRVAHTGDFSAGVATVQCFYAPEFSAHSTGERVKVK
ncbi:UPF0192 protein [Fibrisoma limi BUZ 3]|uniref:UPF0192 protein n=1 Tax=Fibrisoma limi BUZ 3 TaxID=1185876 RepID=I2GRY2_9BACT|nr:alpha-2-macroglobulin family protein [Fibrisoma limi]CCH56660.1 UPF0192 protein [Fibrisoma limi BUZ 3]